MRDARTGNLSRTVSAALPFFCRFVSNAGEPGKTNIRLPRTKVRQAASLFAFCINCDIQHLMRTTLDIDLDVLQAAKEMAGRTKRTAGEILSDLARKALVFSNPADAATSAVVNGFEVMPAADRVVTAELVRKLMEESDKP